MPEPAIAVGYVRVSSAKDEQATSPEVQRAMIAAECARQGWQLACVFEDRRSGGSLDRPDFHELTAYMEHHPVGVLVVKDLSRFGRESLDYLRFTREFLKPRGITLHAVHGVNGEGSVVEMVRQIEMAVGENMRLQVVEKTLAAKAVGAQRGYWDGSIPFGYYSNKLGRPGVEAHPGEPCVLQPDPDTAPVVRQFFVWAGEGLGSRAIARRLNLAGALSPRGARWCCSTVLRILASRVYVGEITRHGQWLPGAHAALVDARQWQAAQQVHLSTGGVLTREPGRYLLSRVYCQHYGKAAGGLLPVYGAQRYGRQVYELGRRDAARETAGAALDALAQRFPRQLQAEALERAILSVFLSPVGRTAVSAGGDDKRICPPGTCSCAPAVKLTPTLTARSWRG